MRRLAKGAAGRAELDARISVCRACPRLVAWREEVAVTKRAAFADQPYWGRPVPALGPPDAPVVVVGVPLLPFRTTRRQDGASAWSQAR